MATQAEARAIARYVRMTPRKLRLVVDLVRGRQVKDALDILKFVPKYGAKVILKVINSAVANAENEPYKMDVENLYISSATVDQGPVLKRFIPRAQGRASAIRKRMSHVTIKLREREEPVRKTEVTGKGSFKSSKSGRRDAKVAEPKLKGERQKRSTAATLKGKKKEAK